MNSALVTRLRSVIEEETACIKNHDFSMLTDHNRAKTQLLLEVSRAIKSSSGEKIDDGALAALQKAIEENHRILELNYLVWGEVGELLNAAAIRHHSDGTYQSPTPGLKGA